MPSHCSSLLMLLLRSSSVSHAFSAALLVVAVWLAITPATRAQDITVSGTDGPRSKAADGKARKSQEPLTLKTRVAAGRLPPSRLYSHINADAIATHRLSRLTEKFIRRQQSLAKRIAIGVTRKLPRELKFTSDATTFDTPEGRISLIKIVAEDALQLRAHFTDVALPEGARLFVYSAKNPDEVYGAFTNRGPSDTGEFWTPPVEGDVIIIEYVTPPTTTDFANDLSFTVDSVNHIYRDPRAEAQSTDGAKTHEGAGACNQTIPEEWKAAARSVGKVVFISDGVGYICTGTLLNTRNNDLTPYFITANHCISTAAEAQSAVIYWNFDTPVPSSTSSFYTTLLSTNVATDYTLLMIDGALPTNLRWAGWTTINSGVGAGVTGIHHPQGDYKRISYGNTVTAGCPSGDYRLLGACENFYKVRWTSGTTEGGSSGSGIWTGTAADPLFVGTLTGGAASCSNQSGVDYYGRFDLTYPAIANFLEGGSDDELESNDTRMTARVISSGRYDNLVVKSTDDDWYRITLSPGSVLRATATSIYSTGNVNLQLFRGDGSVPTNSSNSYTGIDAVSGSNTSGGNLDYFLRVHLTEDTRNSYSLNISTATCDYTLSHTSATYERSSNTGTIVVRSTKGCSVPATSNAGWIRINLVREDEFGGSDPAHATVYYGVTSNDTTSARTGTITIAGQIFTITQQGVQCSYDISPTTRDFSQSGGTGLADVFTLESFVCGNWTPNSDADWIKILKVVDGSNRNVIPVKKVIYSVTENTNSNARTGTITIGTQKITVTQVGKDPLWEAVAISPNQVELKTWYSTIIHQGYAKLTLPSTGYRVADWGQIVKDGNSLYADVRIERSTRASLPTTFTSAHIYDLVTFVAGGYTFDLKSSGAVVGSASFALPAAPSSPNPINDAQKFALEHYRDFLAREPDEPGLNFWTREITSCNGDAQCIDRKRVNVSGSFFLSQEFQATGYYVYRMYKGALGRTPYYSEFIPDAGKVAAGIVVSNRLSADVINANKEAFAREFVGRVEFRTMYDSTSDAEFVDRLFQKTGVTPTAAERDALLAVLSGGAGTQSERRASVLLRIVDGIRAVPPTNGGVEVNQVFETSYGKAFYDREYNPAFVQMQYFGYLRRDPDEGGFNFWLGKLNRFGNFKDAEMVRSFILAPEYRARFGQP